MLQNQNLLLLTLLTALDDVANTPGSPCRDWGSAGSKGRRLAAFFLERGRDGFLCGELAVAELGVERKATPKESRVTREEKLLLLEKSPYNFVFRKQEGSRRGRAEVVWFVSCLENDEDGAPGSSADARGSARSSAAGTGTLPEEVESWVASWPPPAFSYRLRKQLLSSFPQERTLAVARHQGPSRPFRPDTNDAIWKGLQSGSLLSDVLEVLISLDVEDDEEPLDFAQQPGRFLVEIPSPGVVPLVEDSCFRERTMQGWQLAICSNHRTPWWQPPASLSSSRERSVSLVRFALVAAVGGAATRNDSVIKLKIGSSFETGSGLGKSWEFPSPWRKAEGGKL